MSNLKDPATPTAEAQAINARRKGASRLLLPAMLLPLWFAMGYAGIELSWALHLAWHPGDGGHSLAYWRHGLDGPRFLMLVPPMVGALPLAMVISNTMMSRMPGARLAMQAASTAAQAQYAASQRALLKFALAMGVASALAAVLGAWLG